MSDLVGKTIGSYRVLEQIGVGGMATVYKAYQPSMDRDVAIKILPHYLSQDAEFVKRFQREARAIAKLEHAHILPVHDYGEYEGITYLVMRYVEAGTLKQRMAQGPMPLEEIDRIIGQVGGALEYAHRLGVIHRDIKPGNILMDSQGDTFLTDFGLARMMEGAEQLTATGVGVGTPAYMSPEQGQGVKADRRSDIYSLGVILYEMVTGHVPFEAETPMAVVIKHITDPLPLPHTVAPNVPEPVERIILKALAKNPTDRFQTAGEMVQALSAAVRQASTGLTRQVTAEVTRPITIPADAPAVETPPRASAHNGLAIVGVILSLFGAIIGPGLLYSATGNYLKGPLWIVAALVLVAAVGSGMWGLRQERSRPSRWGRLEAGFGVGLGGLAIVAFLAIGLTVAPRFFGGGILAAPSPVFVTEGTLGPLLFEDNFDNGPATRWEFNPARWEAARLDGRTVMRSDTSQSNATAFLDADDWTDYAAQFDFKFLKPDEHNASYFYLRFRTGNCPSTVPAVDNYVALISTDAVELRDESCETQMQEPVASSDRNITGDGWHTAQVIAIGNRVRLLIDGEQTIDYTDPESPHLDGGLWLYTENKVELAIDNFRVYEIILGEAAATATPTVAAPTYVTEGTAGSVLFEDDFEDGVSPAWFQLQPGWQADAVDGRGVLHGAGQQDGNLAFITNKDWADFTLQTEFNFIGVSQTDNYHISIFARWDDCPPEAQWLSTYNISITYSVIELSKSTCDTPREWAVLESVEHTAAPREWHALQVAVVGNRIQVFLDGEQIIDHFDADSPIMAGGVALATVDGTEALFDNVRVTEIVPAEYTLGDAIFEDDFETGGLSQWTAGGSWEVTQDESGNSVLHPITTGGDFQHILASGSSAEDYSVQLRFKILDAPPGGGFRSQDPEFSINVRTDWGSAGCNRYQIVFESDEARIHRNQSAACPDTMLQRVSISPEWNVWHTARVVVYGTTITVYLDESKIVEATDDQSAWAGGLGLEAGTGMEVFFDDVRVTEIIPGLACAPGQTELFSDDFDDGDAQGWHFSDEGGATTASWPVELQDGNYVLIGSGHNWATTGDKNWRNYVISLRVRRPPMQNAAFHFNTYLAASRYAFHYPGGGLFEGGATLDSLAQADLPQDSDWHTLALSVVNGRIEVIFDGRLVAFAESGAIASGQIGIENLEGTLWYDDVLVCGASAD